MRFWLKKLTLCLLAVLLAAPILTTGCRTRHYEQDDYRQWEHDTNRPHQDLDRRSQDEQKQYRDWQQTRHDHSNGHPNDNPNNNPNNNY